MNIVVTGEKKCIFVYRRSRNDKCVKRRRKYVKWKWKAERSNSNIIMWKYGNVIKILYCVYYIGNEEEVIYNV